MKRFSERLAWGLVLCLLVSVCLMLAVSADEDPIPVSSIADLYAIRLNLSGNYKLMCDIDLTEATAPGGDWALDYGWEPIGTSSAPFTGTFDGNYHTIKGMQIYGELSGAVGLFGTVSGATISNLRLTGFNMDWSGTSSNCGLLIGKACNGSTITNIGISDFSMKCWNSGWGSSTVNFGVLAGSLDGATVSSSYVVNGHAECGSSNSTTWFGGITGYLAGTIDNCLVNIDVTAKCTSTYSGTPVLIGGIVYNTSQYSCTIKSCISMCTYQNYAPSLVKIVPISQQDQYGYFHNTNCYYLKGDCVSGGSNGTYLGLTAKQFTNPLMMSGLDFENVWFIDTSNGIDHPQLRSNPEDFSCNTVLFGEHEGKYYISGVWQQGWFEGNYYRHSDGLKVTSSGIIGGKYYTYSEETGLTLGTGEYNRKYYVNGVATHGWHDGNYYLYDSLLKVTQNRTVGGKYYVYDETTGLTAANGEYNQKYYVNGIATYGWHDGNYYLYDSLLKVTQNRTIGGKYYVYDEVTGLSLANGEYGNKYYDNGVVAYGWRGTNYYLANVCTKVTENRKIGGKFYVYDAESGLSLANGNVGGIEYVDGYPV